MKIKLNFGTNYAKFMAESKKIRGSLANMTQDMNRASDGFRGMNKAFTGFNNVLSIAKLSLLATAIAGSIRSSLDMIETANLFSVAMGELAVETGKVVGTMSNLYGLDQTNMRNAVGTFGMLAKSMGMNSKQAQTLSLNTAKIGLDLASLTNVPINQVMQDLRSGLLGQSETVYKYGLDVTEAGIKQEAMRQGIKKSVRDMSQGEKMALRYAVMIRQSGLAHGDMAKTIEEPANQLRILHDRIITLSRAIGTIFIPILAKILPYANAVVIVLTDFANSIAKFFGYKEPEVVDTVTAIGEGLKNAEVNTDNTIKALKRLRSVTMGFDELNILPPPPSSTGNTNTSSPSILDGMELPSLLKLFDDVKMKSSDLLDTVRQKMKDVLYYVGLIALGIMAWNLAKFIMDLGGTGQALAQIMKNLELAVPIFMVLAGLVIIGTGLADIFRKAKPPLEAFLKVFAGFLLIGLAVALLIGGWIPIAVGAVVGALVALWLAIWKYWDEVITCIKNFWSKFVEYHVNGTKLIVDFLIGAYKGFFKLIVDVFTGIFNFYVDIWTAIYEFFKNIWTATYVAFVIIINSIATFFVKAWGDMGTFFTNLWSGISTFFSKLWNGMCDGLKTALNYTSSFFIKTWNGIKEFVVIKIPEIINNIVKWFSELPTKIFNGIKAFGSTMTNIGKWMLDGIFGGLSNVKNKVVEFKDNVVNGFKKALGIHSPSRVMRDEVGRYLGMGIEDGLDQSRSGIVGLATSISDDMQNAFEDISVRPNVGYTLNSDFMSSSMDLGVMGTFNGNQRIDGTEMANVMYDAVYNAIINAITSSPSDSRDVVLQVGTTELGRVAVASINKLTKQEGRLLLDI